MHFTLGTFTVVIMDLTGDIWNLLVGEVRVELKHFLKYTLCKADLIIEKDKKQKKVHEHQTSSLHFFVSDCKLYYSALRHNAFFCEVRKSVLTTAICFNYFLCCRLN